MIYKTVILLTLLFGYCSAQAQVSGVKHVIVIGVDGMSPNGIRNAHTPNIDALKQNGSYTDSAKAVLPTSSSPNWASMIMGATPELHGVTSNAWQPHKQTIELQCTGKKGNGKDSKMWPTIYGLLRDQKPNSTIYCFHDWWSYGRLLEKGVCNKKKGPGLFGLIFQKGNKIATRRAVKTITKKEPDFLFIHLDHVDHAGHHYGHGTQEYYDAVSYADVLIGRIINAVNEKGIQNETIILVTADHGGIGKGHGGDSPEEVNIPWIIKGKGIKGSYQIVNLIRTYDTAATLAYILGLDVPECWIGKNVIEVFD